jgi:nitrite reductase/ring-hydroxylating ferredoxin subunit
MTFFPIASLATLHDGYQKAVSIKGRELLLVQEAGQQYILENVCPHAGYPMTNGRIIKGQIRCPMHGYLFALDTGSCTYFTEGPCRGLHTYLPLIRDGQIGLLL